MDKSKLTAALLEALRLEGVVEAEVGFDENNPETILVAGNVLPSRAPARYS